MAERIYILPVRERKEEAVPPSSAGISERKPQSTKPMADRARDAFKERAEGAQDVLRRALERVRRVAHERPLHFVVGIAGAAFALGMALRIWRSKQHG